MPAPKVSFSRVYRFSMNHIIPADVVPLHLSQIHGHDYELCVRVKRSPLLCAEWGFEAARLDEIVNSLVIRGLNGAMVNDHCQTGSSEHLCAEILTRLNKSLIGSAIESVVLRETRKNTIECVNLD